MPAVNFIDPAPSSVTVDCTSTSTGTGPLTPAALSRNASRATTSSLLDPLHEHDRLPANVPCRRSKEPPVLTIPMSYPADPVGSLFSIWPRIVDVVEHA